MKTNYLEFLEHTRERIGDYGKANPEFMGAFSKLHQIGIAAGAISSKNKALIALGISVAVRCDGCIAMHTSDALDNGAAREEIIETIGTAIYMGGGPAVISAAKAYELLKELETARAQHPSNND